MTPRAEASIRDKLAELQKLDIAYFHAKSYLTTPAWQKERDAALDRLVRTIGQYQGGDPTQAVFTLGRCQEIISGVQETLDVIFRYESIKESIRKIEAAFPPEAKEDE